MSFFEFLMVLVGLVGAIAISAILTYLGHITRNWARVKNPTLFLMLTVWMIFNVIGHITGIWAFRFVDLESYMTVFVVMAPVIFFTLASTTLIPNTYRDAESIDLDNVYFASSRAVFCYLALHEAAAWAADYLPNVSGAPPALFMFTMTTIFLVGMTTQNKTTHYVLISLVIASQLLPSLI